MLGHNISRCYYCGKKYEVKINEPGRIIMTCKKCAKKYHGFGAGFMDYGKYTLRPEK